MLLWEFLKPIVNSFYSSCSPDKWRSIIYYLLWLSESSGGDDLCHCPAIVNPAFSIGSVFADLRELTLVILFMYLFIACYVTPYPVVALQPCILVYSSHWNYRNRLKILKCKSSELVLLLVYSTLRQSSHTVFLSAKLLSTWYICINVYLYIYICINWIQWKRTEEFAITNVNHKKYYLIHSISLHKILIYLVGNVRVSSFQKYVKF